MRYKNFLKIGLTAIILINSANLLNAKEPIPISNHITHIANSTSIKEKDIVVNPKIKEKKEVTTFGKVLKYTGFTILGIAGLGLVGLTYFFVQLAKAGTAKRSPKEQNNYDFVEACGKGELDKIKYFLHEKFANIHSDKDLGLRKACAFNHLEVVKYLLTSPELKKHSNIHANDDAAFKSACQHNNVDIIQYLVFEYRIPKNRSIKEFIKDNDEISQIFDKRDLNDQLHQEIKGSETNKKRNKL